MNLLLNKETGLRIKEKHWAIGPHHDPYLATLLVLSLPNGTEAHLYEDGLGRTRYTLYTDHKAVREEEWVSPMRQHQTKANLLAKRHIGLRFDEAEDALIEAEHNSHNAKAAAAERAAGWDPNP